MPLCPRRNPLVLVLGVTLLAACSGGRSDRRLRLGDEPEKGGGTAGDFGNGSGNGDSGVALGDQALRVHVEDDEHMTIELITLACADACADIEAVPRGGHPPYTLRWEDGSSSAKRHVCLDASATLSVTATDTPIHDVEFESEAQQATASVSALVLACPSDGGAPNMPCDAAVSEPPEQLTPDIFGMPSYFAGGAELAPGRYRLSYVDGCMKYDANWAWTVQGAATFQFLLIGSSTSNVLGVAPGTAAAIAFGVAGYASFADCVAANRALAPLDFEFAGGKLGLWQNDFKPEDNLGGEGGKNPTWQLEVLCR